MKVAAKNKTEYFAAAGERAADLKRLDKIIRAAAPNLEPFFFNAGAMTGLGYGPYHYKYASGREGDSCIVGLANQKNYMSLYVCVTKDGKYLPERYAKRLGKANCGKGCIRFKKLDDLDLDAVTALLKEAGQLARDQASLQL